MARRAVSMSTAGEQRSPWGSLVLRNFRAFENTGQIDLAPVTLVFGKNSSGKTSLLRAPLLLRQLVSSQTPESDIPLSGPFVDFGQYRDLVYRNEVRRDVEMSFRFDFGPRGRRLRALDHLPELAPLASAAWVHITIHWNSRSAKPQIDRIAWGFQCDPEASVVFMERQGPRSIRLRIPTMGVSEGYNDVGELNFLNARFLSSNTHPRVDIDIVAYGLAALAEDATRSLTHIGPLREMPARAYRRDQASAVGGTSLGAVGVMGRDPESIASASRALKKLGMAAQVDLVQLAPGYVGVVLTDVESARKINLADVGFGISQVLPILVALASTPPRTLVLIEQPELHLHPENQGALADVLVDFSREKNVGLLVESHSEHILLRLQRRIAEGKVDPNEVAVYVVDRGRIVRSEIDRFGRLDTAAFPQGFFEEEWSEAVALARAAATSG